MSATSPYSYITALEEGANSWVNILDAARLGPASIAITADRRAFVGTYAPSAFLGYKTCLHVAKDTLRDVGFIPSLSGSA